MNKNKVSDKCSPKRTATETKMQVTRMMKGYECLNKICIRKIENLLKPRIIYSGLMLSVSSEKCEGIIYFSKCRGLDK
jgi:hypothetical protein